MTRQDESINNVLSTWREGRRRRNVDDDNDDDDETTHMMLAYVILLEKQQRREGKHFSHGHSRIEAIGAPRAISLPFTPIGWIYRCRCRSCRLLNERSNRARMRYESFVKGTARRGVTGSAYLNFTARTEGRPVYLSGLFACGWTCLVIAISSKMRFARDPIVRVVVQVPPSASRFGFSRRRSNTWETRDCMKISRSRGVPRRLSSLDEPQ